MGCVSSGTAVDKEAKKRTQEIEKQLKIDKERAAREVKMLMLGLLLCLYNFHCSHFHCSVDLICTRKYMMIINNEICCVIAVAFFSRISQKE